MEEKPKKLMQWQIQCIAAVWKWLQSKRHTNIQRNSFQIARSNNHNVYVYFWISSIYFLYEKHIFVIDFFRIFFLLIFCSIPIFFFCTEFYLLDDPQFHNLNII